jgi:4-hydroxy-3-methylbut-2-enyl diphosphate reductase
MIETVKNKIGENALMTGSGSAVFGLFKDESEAQKKFKELKEEFSDVYLTKTVNKNVELAKTMGFCFGVKRAVDEIEKLKNGEDVFVLGKLIHNPQVIEQLERDGIKMIDSFEGVDKGVVVISAHGVPDKTIEGVKERGVKVVDLTCPLVKKVHDITKEEEKKGRKVIIFGDEGHTEVKGIVGNLKNYKVIKDLLELNDEDKKGKITLVSQTTRDVKQFNEISAKIKEMNQDSEIKDTICIATKDRQSSSIELAKKSELMIVVGGKMSSNTKRLAEICSKFCETKYIETENELEMDWFLGKEKVGITAGASTSSDTINRVKETIERII